MQISHALRIPVEKPSIKGVLEEARCAYVVRNHSTWGAVAIECVYGEALVPMMPLSRASAFLRVGASTM